MKSRRLAILIVLAGAIAAGVYYYYSLRSGERIILLPQADGKPSGVVVQTKTGATTVLDRPYSVARVTQTRVTAEQTDEAEVRTRYKPLFDAFPPVPRSYLLYFETGRTKLTPDSEKRLETVLTVLKDLKELPAAELIVIGHADEVGSDALNDELSLQRAASMASLLKSKGVEAARVSVVGRGSRDPLVPTAKGQAQAQNRRVEIRLK